MKIITEINNVIKLVPRGYPIEGDTVTAVFLNEESGITPVITFNWSVSKNLLVLDISNPTELISNSYYELSVFNNDVLIYKGKCVRLDDDTDVQNFNPQKQNTTRWQ